MAARAAGEPQVTSELAQIPDASWRDRKRPVPLSWTRHGLAWTVVMGYLILLTAVVGTAIALVFTARPVNDVQQVVVTLGGALSALAGMLGFVVGYYFKSEELARKPAPEAGQQPGEAEPPA